MAKPRLKPTAGYALIKPLEMKKTTPSGIVLPDTHDEKSQRGKVMAIGGPRVTDSGKAIKPEFKVGDQIVYKKWGGDEVKLGLSGEEYIFVKFEDVLAIMS
ncbi:co-chaperone GroES [Patescibacteria group bacterium]